MPSLKDTNPVPFDTRLGESIAIPTTKGPITIINQNTGAKQSILRQPASGKASFTTTLASLILPYGSLYPTGVITVSSSNATSSRLTIFSLSTSESLTFSAPEPLTCLSTTNTGLCLAGGSSGRIYIWKTTTGEMLTFLDVHFKPLTSISLVNNKIVTTSLDSLVHVLEFNTVLSGDSTPSHTLDKHALGVTDSSVGLKTIYSVGKDCMLWTWEVETGRKNGYVYPRMLSKICLDVLERVSWVGDVGGSIYQTTLVSGDEGSVAMDGVKESLLLSHHTREITGLTQSLDGSRLVSSSLDGSVVLWDTKSGQAVNVLFHQETPVFFALSFPTPRNLGDEDGGGQDSALTMPIVPLKKFPGQDPGSCLVLPRISGSEIVSVSNTTSKKEGEGEKSLQAQVLQLEDEKARLVAANEILYGKLVSK